MWLDFSTSIFILHSTRYFILPYSLFFLFSFLFFFAASFRCSSWWHQIFHSHIDDEYVIDDMFACCLRNRETKTLRSCTHLSFLLFPLNFSFCTNWKYEIHMNSWSAYTWSKEFFHSFRPMKISKEDSSSYHVFILADGSNIISIV